MVHSGESPPALRAAAAPCCCRQCQCQCHVSGVLQGGRRLGRFLLHFWVALRVHPRCCSPSHDLERHARMSPWLSCISNSTQVGAATEHRSSQHETSCAPQHQLQHCWRSQCGRLPLQDAPQPCTGAGAEMSIVSPAPWTDRRVTAAVRHSAAAFFFFFFFFSPVSIGAGSSATSCCTRDRSQHERIAHRSSESRAGTQRRHMQ